MMMVQLFIVQQTRMIRRSWTAQKCNKKDDNISSAHVRNHPSSHCLQNKWSSATAQSLQHSTSHLLVTNLRSLSWQHPLKQKNLRVKQELPNKLLTIRFDFVLSNLPPLPNLGILPSIILPAEQLLCLTFLHPCLVEFGWLDVVDVSLSIGLALWAASFMELTWLGSRRAGHKNEAGGG